MQRANPRQHPLVPPPPVPERKDSKLSSGGGEVFDHVVDELSALKCDQTDAETQFGHFIVSKERMMYPSPSKSFQMHQLSPQSLMPYVLNPQQQQHQQQHHQQSPQQQYLHQLQQQQQQHSYRINRLKSEDIHEYASEEEEDVKNKKNKSQKFKNIYYIKLTFLYILKFSF